jgi:hypothetical protein
VDSESISATLVALLFDSTDVHVYSPRRPQAFRCPHASGSLKHLWIKFASLVSMFLPFGQRANWDPSVSIFVLKETSI